MLLGEDCFNGKWLFFIRSRDDLLAEKVDEAKGKLEDKVGDALGGLFGGKDDKPKDGKSKSTDEKPASKVTKASDGGAKSTSGKKDSGTAAA